jgi:exopolysaccharide biosynthesis polyprenyl glycosylphosphotransferase
MLKGMAVERINSKKQWRIRVRERRFILLIGDLIVSYLSVLIGLFFWGQKDWLHFSWEFVDQRAPFWFYLLPFFWILIMMDLYDVSRANRRKDTLKGVATAALLSVLLYMVIFFISDPNSLPRRGVAIFVASATLFTILWRFFYIRVFTAPIFSRRVLIIGAGKAGSTFAGMLNKLAPPPYTVVGFVDDDQKKQEATVEGYPVLGTSKNLLSLIQEKEISDLLFAISGDVKPDMFRNILFAEEQGIEVTSLPVSYEEIFGRVPIFLLQSDWILRTFIDQTRTSGIYETAKRMLDVVLSLFGAIVLIILLPFVSLLIILDSGFPVFYHQPRVGKNGVPYNIYKFRTMVKDAEKAGARTASENDQRITKTGKLLRKSHIDELPQVLNILKGEMTIVGPRSEQIELVDKFQKELPFYRARLLAKPGLTGWAQINQRYATTTEDTAVKLEYDLYYIKHRNLILDLAVIIRTVGAVIGFKGL